MATHDSPLTTKQLKALAALLSEPTVTAAAAKCGIGERTLHHYLRVPAFADAYAACGRDAVSTASVRLQHASGSAVAALVEILDDTTAPSAVKISAAKIVLELSLRFREQDDIERRISALENLS